MSHKIVVALTLSTLIPIPSLALEVKVRPGETLSDISFHYKVPVRKIVELNGLQDPNEIQAGRKLILPSDSQNKSIPQGGNHKVSSGETLSKIAKRYKVRQLELLRLNDLRSADYLYVGQTIKLPSNNKSYSANNFSNHKVSKIHGFK